MLRVHRLTSPQAKREWLHHFKGFEQTWLVSDLKSKLELQRHLLASSDHLPEHAVLRASELWRHLAWRLRPDWRVVSLDLIRSLLQQHLENEKVDWARGHTATRTLTQLMPQFLPLFRQIPDLDLVREWLREHPQSLVRWGHWFELAVRTWSHLEENKTIPASWLPGLLIGENQLARGWARTLVVDLGPQMTPLESELLRRLGEEIDVEILLPQPSWVGAFRDTFGPYEKWTSPKNRETRLRSRSDLRAEGPFRLRRFASPLAEVKDAVAQVRQWLEQGVRLDSIGLVAPDIEAYWPLLAPALSEEGVAVLKGRTVRAQALSKVQTWLATLRLEMGGSDRGDLEMATFAEERAPLSYDRFRRLFTNIYDREQLRHEKFLADQFALALDPQEVISCVEFVSRAAARWRGSDLDICRRLIKQLLEDAPTTTRLPIRLWMDWFASSLGSPKMEVSVELPRPGIHCVNLLAGEWLNTDHVYFLGLNEENLREFQVHGLSSIEVSQLERDLGVILPGAETGPLEFEARWLLDLNFKAAVLSCTASDFAGAPLTPSRLWMVQSLKPRQEMGMVSAPQATRWDEIQRAPVEEITRVRWWSEERSARSLLAWRQDLGLEPIQKFLPARELSLSASTLEKYAKCPFTFAVEKLFQLRDEAAVDLDLDPSSRGLLMHGIFERLTLEPRRWQWEDADLIEVVETARAEIQFPDLGLWPGLRQKFVEMAKRFLKVEKKWHEQFPHTRTLARELRFKGWWSLADRRLVAASANEGEGFLLTGQIDRVDGDGLGEYVVLDYKSSARDLAGVETWVKNDRFQLGLYAQAVEAGCTDLPAGQVRGAFYYVMRNLERNRGLHVHGPSRLVATKGPRNTGVDPDRKQDLLEKLSQRMNEVIEGIRGGAFAPRPKTLDLCDKCQWRNQCRAPHLS